MNEEIKTRIIKSLINDLNRVVGSGFVLDDKRLQYNVEYIGDSPKIELKVSFRKEEADYIESPMEFEKVGDNTLGIKFGNNQSLFYSINKWNVGSFYVPIKTKICKTPTPQNELEVGKWYYCMDCTDMTRVNYINNYHLYLGEDKYMYITGEDIIISKMHWINWYEVVEDEY